MAEKLEQLVARLEQATARLEKISVGGKPAASSGGASVEEDAPQVVAYDEFVQASVKPFFDASNKIGGDLVGFLPLVQKALDEHRKLIVAASKSQKPTEQVLAKALTGLTNALQEIGNFKGKYRGNLPEFVNAATEGIQCLTWVAVPSGAISYIKEMVGSAQFHSNKALVKYKNAPLPGHQSGEANPVPEWANSLKGIIENLAAYVKEHHMTGLQCNPKSTTSLTDALAGASSAPAKAAPATAPATGGAPPPPPKGTPPPPAFTPPPAEAGGSAGGMDKVMEQIRAGAVTSGLKHVTKEMKTKNQPGRSAVVPAQIAPKKAVKGPGASEKTGTPRFELVDEKKWVIEWQVGNKEIVVENPEIKHTIYIYGCKDSLIQVKGKVNAITVDNCSKTALVFENVVASVEFVNCKSIQAQANGAVPTIIIDKTDGAQLYLCEAALQATVVTSKSSEMNINVPKGDDEFDEIPVPEQFVTVWDPKAKKLKTEPNSHV